MLNIINLNIYSIQVEGDSRMKNKQRTGNTCCSAEGCTNMDAGVITKQDTNGQSNENQSNKSINYFYSSDNIDADKRKSSTMMQKIYMKHLAAFLMVLGASKAHFYCSFSLTASHTKCTPRHVAYALQKTVQGRAGMPARNGHHHTPWGR